MNYKMASDDKTEIFEVLKNNTEGLTAIEIAQHLGKDKASDVNPLLYKLFSSKLILKADTEQKRPIWILNINVASVLDLLKEHPGGLSPNDIAKMIGMKNSKEVNPLLYGMNSNEMLKKVCDPDGKKPLWFIA